MPWTPVQQKVQQWMAMPKELRPKTLRTKAALARCLKLAPAVIYRWQATIGWWDEVYKFARIQIGEDLPGILKAMVSQALGGDVRAAKLCLEVLGVHADKLILQGTIKHDGLVVLLDERRDDGDGDETTVKSSLNTEEDDDPDTSPDDIVVFEELFSGQPDSANG